MPFDGSSINLKLFRNKLVSRQANRNLPKLNSKVKRNTNDSKKKEGGREGRKEKQARKKENSRTTKSGTLSWTPGGKKENKKRKKMWINNDCCWSLVVQSCSTLCDPMDCSRPGFPVLHYLPSLLKLMSTELVPSNSLILCGLLLLLGIYQNEWQALQTTYARTSEDTEQEKW